MLRSEAVTRINDAIGFRPAGHSLESKIILRLKEAQRDLEKGKTLPRFMIREDQTLTLAPGEHNVALPSDFIRVDDNNGLSYLSENSFMRGWLTPVHSVREAIEIVQTQQHPDQPAINMLPPRVYVIRPHTSVSPGVVEFVSTADREYVLTWSYFAADAILDSDIENRWLANASEWLIGDAGRRIAADLRDQEALALFTEMRQMGRAAVFGDEIAFDDAIGPIRMGSRM